MIYKLNCIEDKLLGKSVRNLLYHRQHLISGRLSNVVDAYW